MIEYPISVLVPTDKTVVVQLPPPAGHHSGVRFIAALQAAAKLDFYLLTQKQYLALPKSEPTRQWYGDHLSEAVSLADDTWYLVVANQRKEPVQLTGSLTVGSIGP